MQVSGLSSGLDTASMVKQLMQVERLQGQGLTKGRTAAQTMVSALTSLNGYMKTLGEAAEAFAPQSVMDTSAMHAVAATSTNKETATATVTDKAVAGSFTFTVKSLAASGQGSFANTFSGTEILNPGSGFDLNISANGKAANVQVPPDAKLADVAAAINDSGIDVKATMVQVAPGTYKLQIASQTTGAQSNISVTDGSSTPTAASLLGTFHTQVQGADTQLQVGDLANGGYMVTSPFREVKDVLPGVTITPVKVDPTAVTIELKLDSDAITGKVEALVKAANDALSNMRVNSKWDAATKSGGPFVGDSTTRTLTAQIQSAFGGNSSSLPSLAGISIDRSGSVTFDKATFTTALAKDPSMVEATMTSLSTNLSQLSKQATNVTDGLLSVRIQGEQSLLKDYTDQISRFEDRMSARQEILERQFSGLETMLNKLQAQGSWLSSQLATLPTSST